MPAPKRDRLLEVSEAVFSKEGFKGVSVDRLLKEAGVAKMTLYKGFESKDALICETLRRRADRLAKHVHTAVEDAGPSANDRLLSCFDAMESWSKRKDFNGCYFINALGEFNGEESDVGEIVRRYKAGFLSQLETLCQACEIPDPKSFARNVLMIIDGATVTHMTLGDHGSYARAKALTSALLTASSSAARHVR